MRQFEFVTALKFAGHAMAKDDSRYMLNGVCMKFNRYHDTDVLPTCEFIGTDGHRMARITLQFEHDLYGEYIIPRIEVLEMIKLFRCGKASNDKMEITESGDGLSFLSATITHPVTPIDGKFPNIDRVMPKGRSKKAMECGINTRYMFEAYKAAMLVVNVIFGGVKVQTWSDAKPTQITIPVDYDFDNITGEAVIIVMPMRL